MRNATDNMYEVLTASWKLVYSLGNTTMLLYKDTCSQPCTQQLGSRSSALLFLYLRPDCFSMACTWCLPSAPRVTLHMILWDQLLYLSFRAPKEPGHYFHRGLSSHFTVFPNLSLYVCFNLIFISVQRIATNDVAHVLYKWGNITIQAMIWWPQILASE